MKEILKKYPKLPLFIGGMVLMCVAFAAYMIWYEGKNTKNQKIYDDLKETAWVTVSEDTTSENSLNNPDTTTTSENIVEEHLDSDIEKFLAECGDEALYKEYVTNVPDFKQYTDMNEDVIAYIVIPGTKVSYPILQHKTDDEYYLNHNIDGSKGYPGCLYIESLNHSDFNDPVTVVYGHNMKNNTMFGTLDDYRKEEYRLEHQYFIIYTKEYINIYQIAICSVYDESHLLSHDFEKDEDGNWVFMGLRPDDQKILYKNIDDFKGWNRYMDPDGFEESDSCVALATCSGEGKRYIVVGKKIYNVFIK